jgi:hypothetical protein
MFTHVIDNYEEDYLSNDFASMPDTPILHIPKMFQQLKN